MLILYRRALCARSVTSKSSTELANLQDKRNVLMHRIYNWQKVQDIYMPSIISLRLLPDSLEEGDHSSSHAEQVNLFLPSTCPSGLKATMVSLLKKEKELRIAQAQDSLAHIRRLRRILVNIAEFKRTQTSGTGNRSNTRMRTLFNKFQNRVKLAASRYRAAYAALLLLDSNGEWRDILKELRDDDIRGPKRDDEDEFTEGTYEPSWIWLVQREADTSQEFSDAMRVEWAKTKARAERWSEEVRLLQEEMRRVLEYCSWKGIWWRSRQRDREDVDRDVLSGLEAYAHKQATIWERLGQSFGLVWSSVLQKHQLVAEWQGRYSKMPRNPSLWELIEEEEENRSDYNWFEDKDEDGDIVMEE